jgi:pimeloyl-ACP methyl ester carboxylesterase
MQKRVEYQDELVYYRLEGKGKSVVLLHGFAEDGNIFNQQIDFLKDYCSLIVIDLPGSGQSKFNPRLSTIEDYAECVHALLKDEQIQHCTMLGHSMGGYITLAFAEKYGAMLTSFGLMHSTAYPDSAEKKRIRLKAINTIEIYGADTFIKTTVPNLFAKKFKEEHPDQINTLIANAHFAKEALQQYYSAMMNRPDKTNVLRGSKVPVLFIIGEEDTAIPLNDILRQTSLPQQSYIHVLENVGHMGMWEATEKVNEYLLEFINKC